MENIIGDNLKLLMNLRNISREELAKEIGLSYWTIAKYIRGERTPDSEVLGRIADYFGVTTDFLIGRETISDEQGNETKLNPRAVQFMLRAEEKLSIDKYNELLDWAERMAKMLEEEEENE